MADRFRLFLMTAAAVLLLVLPAMPVRAQMSQLRLRSYEVKQTVPRGLRTVRATVKLELVNGGEKPFAMEDVRISIYRNGVPYVQGVCPSIPVDVGVSVVEAVGTFQLCEGISLWSALRTLLNIKIEEYSADISLQALGDYGTEQSFMLRGFSVGNMLKARHK